MTPNSTNKNSKTTPNNSTFQINSLPAPYGTCLKNYQTSVAECQRNCKTLKFVGKCGCRDASMNNLMEGM